MTGSLSPKQIEELMAGYILGDLSAEETEQLLRLLAQNPQLAAEARRLQETLELMPYGLPEVEPPSHLRLTILEAASININRNPLRKLSRLPWSRIAAGVAAVLALVLGLDNYRLRQALQATQTEAQQFARLYYSLQGTKIANTASASVIVNPNNLEAQLIAKNLPPLPSGKVYVLWTVLKQDAPFTTDDKGAILTGVFNIDAQGKVSQTFTVPKVYRSKKLVTKIAVTIENAASPQKHEGVPILSVSL